MFAWMRAIGSIMLMLMLSTSVNGDDNLWNYPNIVLDNGEWHKIRTPFFRDGDPRRLTQTSHRIFIQKSKLPSALVDHAIYQLIRPYPPPAGAVPHDEAASITA